jgi:carbonic anhydrase
MPKILVMTGLLAFPVTMVAAAEPDALWGYSGDFGPEHWGDMTGAFDSCRNGETQSPVDISTVTIKAIPDISFDYQASPLQVVDNGRMIQLNYSAGSHIRVGDKSYQLLEFHFHNPSEHTIGGKRYPMAVHLVHQADNGKLAIIAVMMKEGAANALMDTLWSMLPTGKGLEKTVDTMMISATALVPADKTYFSYTGSLTTPPCSESVDWLVMAQAVEVSASQIEKFKRRYAGNSRPLQPLNQRRVLLAN